MIKLRNVTELDALIIHEWKSDPYLQTMALGPNYKSTIENVLEDIQKSIESKYSDYQIITYRDEPIGYIRTDWITDELNVAWLRYALGPKYRGKGSSKPAIEQYLTKLFNEGCHRIECEVYASNIPSRKVLNGLGFHKEGVKRQAHFDGEKWIDLIVYGMLKCDYYQYM